MLRKPTKYAAGHHRTAGSLYLGVGLLFLFLLSGCPVFDETYSYHESYHVYYEGNGNTEGIPPMDSKVYYSGHTAAVLAKPEGLKKGNLTFLGWQRPGNNTPLKPGDKIRIDSDIWLYAWWEDDPNNIPYEYAGDPQTGGVIITRYFMYPGVEYGRTLTIPNTMDGKPVTVIGEGAFAGAYLEEIVLPNKLEVIGNKAFAGNRLDTIVIPDTVKSIGMLAFQNSGLQTISLGSGLESIGDYAFESNYLTVLLLPASVKSLGIGAFYGSSLVSIEIGGNVDIKSAASLGTYGASFRIYYQDKGSLAGVYLYDSGSWRGPYRE
jgi:hypothetical protein